MAKMWDKGRYLNDAMEKFTVGNDFLLDKKLVKYDCLASIAHAKMLHNIGVLTNDEMEKLVAGLNEIINLKQEFVIKQEDEDCHTAIENFLVKKLGEVGNKIHTCRSRNDQVLAALRLYEKEELVAIKKLLDEFKESLLLVIKKSGDIPLPGYTHMQKAMPSSVKMWLGSFVAAIDDDLKLFNLAFSLIDQNPLGSAAGFGVPVFDIDKEYTANELGFSSVMDNPMYAQLSRGKFESTILHLLTQIMLNINKLSTDLMLFSTEEFGYLSLPNDLLTGSSIMPQKNNPDILELLRAKYHIIVAESFKVKGIISNLMSGYNRDLQLTKEPVMNSIDIVKECVEIIILVISRLTFDEKRCRTSINPEIYATQEAYKLVKKGIPFREAYKQVSKDL